MFFLSKKKNNAKEKNNNLKIVFLKSLFFSFFLELKKKTHFFSFGNGVDFGSLFVIVLFY